MFKKFENLFHQIILFSKMNDTLQIFMNDIRRKSINSLFLENEPKWTKTIIKKKSSPIEHLLFLYKIQTLNPSKEQLLPVVIMKK